MLQKEFQKKNFKFYCEKCDYYSKRKSQFERHLQTNKHKHNKCYINATDKVPYKCLCGKIYKHHSSFYRHKKECKYKPDEKETNIEKLTTDETVDLVKALIIENKKLQEQMMCVQEILPTLGNTQNNINSNNNIINVNMFLNEKCADAMSIQNFANQLLVTMDDLSKSKKDCISNVVLKNLKPLSLTQRPFHCTNVKNKEWYVKDENDGWEEDNGEKLIKTTEYGIQKKWTTAFEQMYPDWMRDTELRDKYIEIAGSTTSELPEKIKLKLLRELASESTLGKKELCV